jgi:iron complex outermembrane receptor protein
VIYKTAKGTRMKQKILTLAILSALSSPAFSQSELTPITVEVATPNEQTQAISDLIKQSGNTESGALLREINGIDAQRLGGHGLDILIRGQGKSAVNVLIDGGKIEGGCPNRMDPPTAYTELNSFDKITVIKGVQSLQYGVGGTGGTVLLEREKPTFEQGKPYQGRIYGATGSNGLTRDIGAQVAAGGEQGYIVFQGSNKSADNYKDGNNNEVRSSYETTQGHIDLGWTPNDNHHIKLSHEIANTKDALFQGAGMDAPKSDGRMTRLSYEGKNFNGPINAIEASIYIANVEHSMDNYNLRPVANPMMKMEVPTETTSKGAKLKLTSQIASTQLDYGVLLQSVEKKATMYNRSAGMQLNRSQWLMWPDAVTEQNSLFAEANSALSDTQNLIYGVRVDQVNAKARDALKAPDNTSVAPQPRRPVDLYNAAYNGYSGKTSIDETNWNGLVRYEQSFGSSYRWFAGLSLTTRTADETERFMARADWTGNPDLKAEKHLQFDLGMRQTTEHLNWGINAYYDKVSDYILRDYAKNQAIAKMTGNQSVYVNIDAEIYGAEFDIDYRFNQAWLIGSALALTQGRNTTQSRNLSDMAPLNGHLRVEYNHSNWYAGSRFNFASEQTTVNTEYNEQKAPAWSTLDLYAGYQLNKTFQLQAGVANLFDQAYFTHLNRTDAVLGTNYKVMEPGRNIWARVEAKF